MGVARKTPTILMAVVVAMVALPLVCATDYTVSIRLNALASQAGVISGSSASLVQTSSTNTVPVNSISGMLHG